MFCKSKTMYVCIGGYYHKVYARKDKSQYYVKDGKRRNVTASTRTFTRKTPGKSRRCGRSKSKSKKRKSKSKKKKSKKKKSKSRRREAYAPSTVPYAPSTVPFGPEPRRFVGPLKREVRPNFMGPIRRNETRPGRRASADPTYLSRHIVPDDRIESRSEWPLVG